MIGLALIVSFLWDHLFRFGLNMPDVASWLGAAAVPLAASAAARSINLSWSSIGRWACVALIAEVAGHWQLTHTPNFVWVVVLASVAQKIPFLRWIAWMPAFYCGYGLSGYMINRAFFTRSKYQIAIAAICHAAFFGLWYGVCAVLVFWLTGYRDKIRLPRGLLGGVYALHWLPLLFWVAAT